MTGDGNVQIHLMEKARTQVDAVVSTMAIENMYLSDNFVKELTRVARGERTSEDLRNEVIKKYARQ